MESYSPVFDAFGMTDWCARGTADRLTSMSQLEALTQGGEAKSTGLWDFPFPSLDALHESCAMVPRTRDMTKGIEQLFLDLKDAFKVVLDPLTQPLSWLLDGALAGIAVLPWWIVIPLFVAVTQLVTKSVRMSVLVLSALLLLAFVDHYSYAMQTIAIIFVCTALCVVIGVPIGIAMSKSDRLQRVLIPVLDMLQTLPTFVYLIPLIFLFSVTESKLYGIAIITYAVAPVIRLTNLGIRLVDQHVMEAAEAFGMSRRQKLLDVEIPLALPTIMAGVNQTIMMSLSMVVIASLVSAPGLGVLVLRGISKLELGVGLVAGFAIVLLAITLDRTTKTALARINRPERA
jgi:glycine betaine/proline transport system permease protein